MCNFFGPQFFQEGRSQLFYGTLLARFAIHRWQSLVAFCLLISVCEAGHWHGMQNLWRVDENSRPIWSRLWTKVHVVLRRFRRLLVVCNALARLCISCVIPKIQAVKVALKLRNRWKEVVFGPPICRGKGYSRFWTCIFKSHLLSTMWPDIVEFHSVSSEITGRKKTERKKNPWQNLSPPTSMSGDLTTGTALA